MKTKPGAAYIELSGIISDMLRVAGDGPAADCVRHMAELAKRMERERIEAAKAKPLSILAMHAAEMECQRREADAYARGLADGYRDCAESIGRKIGYEPVR